MSLDTEQGGAIPTGSIPNFDSIRRECGTAPGQTRRERRIGSGGSSRTRDIVAEAEDLLWHQGAADEPDDARISPTLFLAGHQSQEPAPVGGNVLDFCATPRDHLASVSARQDEGGMGHLLSPRQGWSAGHARSTARRSGDPRVRSAAQRTDSRRGTDTRDPQSQVLRGLLNSAPPPG